MVYWFEKTISKKILSSKILELKKIGRYFFQQREVKQSGQRAAGGEFFFGIFAKFLISQTGFFFRNNVLFPRNFLSSKFLELKDFLAFFVRNNFLFPKKILSSEVPKFWKLRIFWPRSCLARGVRTPRVSPCKIFGRPFSTLNPKVTFKNASFEFKPPQAEFFCLVGICSEKTLSEKIFGT